MTNDNSIYTSATGTDIGLLFSAETGKMDDPAATVIDMTRHDLYSSLNIIIGYAELLLDGVLGRMTEEQRDGVNDILTSGRHLLGVIDKSADRRTPAQ